MQDIQKLNIGNMQEISALKQNSAKFADKVQLVERQRDQLRNRLKAIELDNKRLRN